MVTGNDTQSRLVKHRAVKIDANDRTGTRGDRGFDRGGIDTPSIRQDIDEDFLRSDIPDGRGRRDPRDVGRDHLVTRPDLQCG